MGGWGKLDVRLDVLGRFCYILDGSPFCYPTVEPVIRFEVSCGEDSRANL